MKIEKQLQEKLQDEIIEEQFKECGRTINGRVLAEILHNSKEFGNTPTLAEILTTSKEISNTPALAENLQKDSTRRDSRRDMRSPQALERRRLKRESYLRSRGQAMASTPDHGSSARPPARQPSDCNGSPQGLAVAVPMASVDASRS